MEEPRLSDELVFVKGWWWDPGPPLRKHFELRDLARLAVVQLEAQQEILRVRRDAMKQALELYGKYAK